MVHVRSLTPLPNSPHQPVRALIDLHEHAYLHKLLASTLRAHAASKDLFPGTPAFACTRVRMHIGKRREASERDRDREIEPWAEKHRFPIPHSSFITNTHTHTHTTKAAEDQQERASGRTRDKEIGTDTWADRHYARPAAGGQAPVQLPLPSLTTLPPFPAFSFLSFKLLLG